MWKNVFEQSAAHSKECKKRPVNRHSPRHPFIDAHILLDDLLCNFRINLNCAVVVGHDQGSNHCQNITGYYHPIRKMKIEADDELGYRRRMALDPYLIHTWLRPVGRATMPCFGRNQKIVFFITPRM